VRWTLKWCWQPLESFDAEIALAASKFWASMIECPESFAAVPSESSLLIDTFGPKGDPTSTSPSDFAHPYAPAAGADYFSANILVAQVGKRIGGILSAKAGEGMLSGMCTARLRLVAMEARRPLPFAKKVGRSYRVLAEKLLNLKKTGED
jgi:hypothetical protein